MVKLKPNGPNRSLQNISLKHNIIYSFSVLHGTLKQNYQPTQIQTFLTDVRKLKQKPTTYLTIKVELGINNRNLTNSWKWNNSLLNEKLVNAEIKDILRLKGNEPKLITYNEGGCKKKVHRTKCLH